MLQVQLGILRDIKDAEIDLMRVWRNEPATRVNMYTQHEISTNEHATWWAKTRIKENDKYFMYEIDGIPSGISAFTGIDHHSETSAWAFYASPTAPRGTGSKMEYLMLQYAFEKLKLQKLYCEVLAFNASVIKLHQKFGFKIEGIFRNQYKAPTGFVDIYRLGILSSEWQEIHPIMHAKLAELQKTKI